MRRFGRFVGDPAVDLDHQAEPIGRVEVEVPARPALIELAGRGFEVQRRQPLDIVEPDIAEANGAIVNLRDLARAALGAALAADLEQVGEIGVETDFERDRPPDGAEAANPDALVAGRAAQKFEAADVDGIALQPDLAVGIVKVGIGQIDDHRAIVVEHDRAQLERLHPADAQPQAGQEARVLIE